MFDTTLHLASTACRAISKQLLTARRLFRPNAYFDSLPCELRLQIFRLCIVAFPPSLDASGRMRHELLSPVWWRYRREIHEMIFHTVPIEAADLFADNFLSRRILRVPFLEAHDLIWGWRVRRDIHVTVLYPGTLLACPSNMTHAWEGRECCFVAYVIRKKWDLVLFHLSIPKDNLELQRTELLAPFQNYADDLFVSTRQLSLASWQHVRRTVGMVIHLGWLPFQMIAHVLERLWYYHTTYNSYHFGAVGP